MPPSRDLSSSPEDLREQRIGLRRGGAVAAGQGAALRRVSALQALAAAVAARVTDPPRGAVDDGPSPGITGSREAGCGAVADRAASATGGAVGRHPVAGDMSPLIGAAVAVHGRAAPCP